MEKFKTVQSKVIPVAVNDVDTDQIIPAQFLTSVSKEGYGENLFRRWRDQDPEFPFNKEEYRGAEIMVAGSNFGCGSSREHAVWAITGAGIKVVIAQSFADIFYNNSAKNGLLLVVLPEEAVEKLKRTKGTVEVDLEDRKVTFNDGDKECQYDFDYDPFRRYCLLNGLDDIDYIASYEEKIDAHKSASYKPWLKESQIKPKSDRPQPVSV